MPAKIINLAEQNLFEVSGERDAVLRSIALKRLWIIGGIFIDAENAYNGQHEIGKAAGALLSRFPEFEFWALRAVDSIPGVSRIAWAFGTAGLAPALTGVDVVRMEEQRIVAVYRFVNGAAF
ncbi:MAG: hypothetical protein ACRYFU_19485 [Janthinobacterium lividum]